MFLGYIALGSTLSCPLQTRNASDVPLDADAAPFRHVYSPSGTRLDSAAGQGALLHTGTITGASNAAPIVITVAAHGLQTGARATISGVLGNTAANSTFTVTRVDADTFSLDGSTGNGAYTSGGTFHVSGLYKHAVVASAGNGFAAGNSYFLYSTWAISAAQRAQLDSFTVY